MHLGQTRAVERLHRTDRKPPSSSRLSESRRPVRAAAATTAISNTHHMPLEFQQTCPERSCRGLYLDGICGPAELDVN